MPLAPANRAPYPWPPGQQAALFPREHMLPIWNDEVAETGDWGGLVITVLPPGERAGWAAPEGDSG